MNPGEIRALFLDKAIGIGNHIRERVLKNRDDFFRTPGDDPARPLEERRSIESIHSGVSGILLFLMELYKQTKSSAYLDSLESLASCLITFCKENPTADYSLYTGRMGVSYTLLKLYELTKEERYIENALEIAGGCGKFTDSLYVPDDLFAGKAGTLLGLVHLHAAVKEKWLLEYIDRFISILIDDMRFERVGIYWKQWVRDIKPLCGFARGTAGTGFVFLELGHYFQNETFLSAAEQAFAYENASWNKELENWPDWRKKIFTEKDQDIHEKELLKGNAGFFTRPGDNLSWSHGTAGIMLSRIRASSLLRKPLYKRDINRALKKLKSGHNKETGFFNSPSLYEGWPGVVGSLIELSKANGDDSLFNAARVMALERINNNKEGDSPPGTVDSLFTGELGTGYLCLSLAAPLQVESILFPSLDKQCKRDMEAGEHVYISLPALKQRIISTEWGRTITLLNKVRPGWLNGCFRERENNWNRDREWKKQYTRGVKGIIAGLEGTARQCALDVFSLESTRVKMRESIESYALLYIKEVVQKKEAQYLLNLENEVFLKQRLKVSADVLGLEMLWDWTAIHPRERTKIDINENLEKEPGEYAVILRAVSDRDCIREQFVEECARSLLVIFKKEEVIENAVIRFIDCFEIESEGEKEEVRQFALDAIRIFIHTGVLRGCPAFFTAAGAVRQKTGHPVVD